MEFVALIYGSESRWAALSDDERQAIYQRYNDFGTKDEIVGGTELETTSTATTVRIRNGDRLVTDGPYAEVKEALGGFYLLDCDSIDEACRLAAEIPAAEDGAIEVRPVYVREES
jgi:hypothetical protein